MKEEYAAIIYAGKEERNREYKQSFPWSRKTHFPQMAKVTKTILAMSNLRDGGHIIIGVKEGSNPSEPFIPEGMNEEDLVTFNYDKIADFVRNYAEPYVSFNLDIVKTSNKSFVIIAINGFEEYLVICKKNFDDILNESTVYIRSRGGRPQSAPVLYHSDMRELLDIAIEQGVKRFFSMQARIETPAKDDSKLFYNQLADFS